MKKVMTAAFALSALFVAFAGKVHALRQRWQYVRCTSLRGTWVRSKIDRPAREVAATGGITAWRQDGSEQAPIAM
jgi:hypothetical protein